MTLAIFSPPAKPELVIVPAHVSTAGLRFVTRKETTCLTVHCSATKPSQNFGATDIDRMHRQQGFLCIGYHLVIKRDGTVEAGRPLDAVGSHCRDGNRNFTNIGVCLIGGISEHPLAHVPGNPWNGSDAECNFTPAQFAALRTVVDHFGLPVEGHRDVPKVTKACPSFAVKRWMKTGVAVL